MSNPFLTQSVGTSNINITSSSSSSSMPTMEQLIDVQTKNLIAGQVLVYKGDIWSNIIPQNLVNDTLGSLLDISISSLQNNQFLSYNSSNQMWVNTNINESNVSNLVNDLASCEKTVNKNTTNGYCGLNNGLINIINIPKLPESMIINLTSHLSNKADLISGYLKSSEIPLSVPLNINSVTTSNNILNLTTGNISQGTINK